MHCEWKEVQSGESKVPVRVEGVMNEFKLCRGNKRHRAAVVQEHGPLRLPDTLSGNL